MDTLNEIYSLPNSVVYAICFTMIISAIACCCCCLYVILKFVLYNNSFLKNISFCNNSYITNFDDFSIL